MSGSSQGWAEAPSPHRRGSRYPPEAGHLEARAPWKGPGRCTALGGQRLTFSGSDWLQKGDSPLTLVTSLRALTPSSLSLSLPPAAELRSGSYYSELC